MKIRREFFKKREQYGAGAKKVNVWNVQHGTLEVTMALKLYESVLPLFKYPTRAGHHIRQNAQMNWRAVWNLCLRRVRNLQRILVVGWPMRQVQQRAVLQWRVRQVMRRYEHGDGVTVFFFCFFHRPGKG
jgi:hypothetical protein